MAKAMGENIAALEARLELLFTQQALQQQRAVTTGPASATSKRSASRRKLNSDWRAPPGESDTCTFPPAFNFTNWRGPDVKMMVPWCEPRKTPPSALSLDELAADPARLPHSKVPVVPSLIVPCCAHSGTTFLWRCMRYAFHPSVVCGRVDPKREHEPLYADRHEQWNTSSCGQRRYLLPGLAGNIQGHWDYRKEWFFFGGGASQWMKGWSDYLGVELPLW